MSHTMAFRSALAERNRNNRWRATLGWKLSRGRPGARGRDGRWYFMHKAYWESVFGLVPDGYVLHHKDRDQLNWSLDNLECMTRSEHTILHARLRLLDRQALSKNRT